MKRGSLSRCGRFARAIATVALPLALLSADARADDGGAAASPSASPTETPASDRVKLPARVDAIRIDGLVRTHPSVVRRELGFAEGDVLTREQLDLAVTRLWNTTIFAHVDGEVLLEDGRNVVIVSLEDRWTLNPLFRFGSGGNATFFRLGAADNNLAGRFLEVQAQYENFNGFHGGQVLFREPRLLGERLELLVQADRLVRPRNGFSDQRTQGIVEVARLAWLDRVRYGLRTSVFADRFLAPLDSPPYYPAETETLLLEPGLRLGRIDVVRLRQSGASFELRPGLGFVAGSDVASRFVTMTGEALAFAVLGERWNLAVRLRGSDTSRVPAHLELFAGGLDLVRGFPDNYVRTRALALANVEARFIAFDSTWLALVPTVFADAVAARAPSGEPGTALAVGGGLRVLVPKFVGTGLRVDLAVPVQSSLRAVREAEQAKLGPTTPSVNLGAPQASFGVYQFF
jgi:hypothetical protein